MQIDPTIIPTHPLPTKPWWQSKGLWGGVIAALGAVASMMANGGPTPENLAALAGALIAIYGRIVATTTITAGN